MARPAWAARLAISIANAEFSLCYHFRMTARILDGAKIRDEVFAELKRDATLHDHGQ